MNPSTAQRAQGFGLVEVLIALLVLSLGMMGLLKLQSTSLRHANSSAMRLVAVNLSQDMLERMRANRSLALQGEYNIGLDDTSATGRLKQTELEGWKTALATNLPNGNGSISSDGVQITITAQWTESWDADLGSGVATVSLRSQP